MCRILFGADRVGPECFAVSLININSPLVFDATMMGALEVYARAGRAAIISPFIVGGAMAPVSVAGTLTQIAGRGDDRCGICPARQPRLSGGLRGLRDLVDMNSGAPTFGTPRRARSSGARASWRGG